MQRQQLGFILCENLEVKDALQGLLLLKRNRWYRGHLVSFRSMSCWSAGHRIAIKLLQFHFYAMSYEIFQMKLEDLGRKPGHSITVKQCIPTKQQKRKY